MRRLNLAVVSVCFVCCCWAAVAVADMHCWTAAAVVVEVGLLSADADVDVAAVFAEW